ncbi:serine/threonine protein kinase [Geodermatophilaceae bacterium NBWT11]|nr:serine/threonine protein kinase [Geodermatophilaceae bacterium NBWT11]
MAADRFGPYRLEELIGRGGMGEVHRAWDTEHERTVALKLLSPHLAEDAEYRERFRREAHAAARLAEPHVVPIHRYGEIDGRLFLDMRLVRGDDLADVLHREPLSPERAVSIVGQVAQALDAAHAEGLVHRDVKPSNVLLTGTGEDEFAYLVDFGIARSVADAGGLTQTGAALGSFDYMAPERFLDRPVDGRVDVYGLACVLHECLTGRRPFTGTGLPAVMWAHLNTVPAAPSTLRTDVPVELDAVVARGLAKDPADRFATAGDMARAAREALRSGGLRPRPVVPAPGPAPGPPLRVQTLGFTGPSGGGQSPPSWPPAPVVTGPPPTGPGWGAPPPPPTPAGSGTNPVLVVALAAVVVLALVVVVTVALTRGGGSSVAADPTTDVPPSPTTTQETTTSTPTDPPAASPEDELRAILPADFDADACESRALPADGAIAALDCGGSVSGSGPEQSAFYLYPDEDTLTDVFASDAGSQGLVELTSGSDCPDEAGTLGYRDWTAGGELAGQVGCAVIQDQAVVLWTQLDARAEGFVQVSGDQEDIATLWAWWNDADLSDFQTP